jgi:nicotinic acid mononucleotide adenylyltransferase
VKRGVFPGSFNPVTVAHLTVARAAVEQCGLDRVELTLSRVPLGKAAGSLAGIDHRVRLLERLTVDRPWLGVAVRDERLLVDLATGYDALVVGADKLAQLLDPGWYDSAAEHRAALARLPTVAVAPRAGCPLPDRLPAGLQVVVLDTDPAHREVSATEVRAGRDEWLPAELGDLARESGAWPGLGGAR